MEAKTAMNDSFGSWMLTGGTRSELHEEARQRGHLAAFREARSERRTARRTDRVAAFTHTLGDLRVRFAGGSASTTPDCCPA
jgi:hypothetical protein